jgi:hypothetical protein
MLEELGRDMADVFEDVKFIGLMKGIDTTVLTFNCNKTGATFCGNTIHEVEERLTFIRNNFKFLEERA